MALNVFISHSFKDKELAYKIKKTLKENEINCYLAEDEPEYGKSLPDKIMKAIQICDLVIAILTKDASNSASVNQEIGFAKNSGKNVIPLVEKDAETGILLQGIEVLRFSKETADQAFERAARYIKKKFKKSNIEWKQVLIIVVLVLSVIVGALLIARSK